MNYVIRDGRAYVCQIDHSRYPYSTPAAKEAAAHAAQQRADQIIYEQTQAGIPRDASLADRQRLGGWR